MTYQPTYFGGPFHGPGGATPPGPYDDVCPACGYELHVCVCPGGAGDDAAWLRDWRERVANGELDAPEEGDPMPVYESDVTWPA